MKRITLTLLTIFIFSGPMFAQMKGYTNDSLFIHDFMNTYKNQGVAKSMDFIYSTNKWLVNGHQTQFQSLKSQLTEVVSHLGKYHGSIVIKKVNLKNKYIGYSILMLYERQPIRFILTLYKPSEFWHLQTFQYDSKVGEEVIKSMNLSWDY